jgi:hypothetical protein
MADRDLLWANPGWRAGAHAWINAQLDGRLDRLRDAYLEPWTAFHRHAQLLDVYDDAYRLGALSRLLDWSDLVAASPAMQLHYADAVPTNIRLLLEVLDGKSHVW